MSNSFLNQHRHGHFIIAKSFINHKKLKLIISRYRPLTISYFLAKALAWVLRPEPYGPINRIRGVIGACERAGRPKKSKTIFILNIHSLKHTLSRLEQTKLKITLIKNIALRLINIDHFQTSLQAVLYALHMSVVAHQAINKILLSIVGRNHQPLLCRVISWPIKRRMIDV